MTMLVPIGHGAATETWGPSWFGIRHRPYSYRQPSRKLAGKYEGFVYISMPPWLVPDHVILGGAAAVMWHARPPPGSFHTLLQNKMATILYPHDKYSLLS